MSQAVGVDLMDFSWQVQASDLSMRHTCLFAVFDTNFTLS
jgi:hypothetical protein